MSLFSVVCARFPIWGFGTINSLIGGSGPGGIVQVGDVMTHDSTAQGTSYRYVQVLNAVWPAIYTVLTETWTEPAVAGPYGGFPGGGQTVVTQWSNDSDASPNPAATITPTGSYQGAGTISSITLTSTTITIDYAFTYHYFSPLAQPESVACTGTYVAQLSGTPLQPSGAGPFNPSDATYGWAAITAQCMTLLGEVSSIPSPASGSLWTTVDTSTAGSGYKITTNYYNSSTLWEYIGAAAYGLPTSPSFCTIQFMPPTILDLPDGSTDAQPPTGAYFNEGACMCMKSTWILNGAGWGNTTYSPNINDLPPLGLGDVMNDHAIIYSQEINLTNFLSAGTVALASAYPNPIAWPTTITFNPSDVTTAIGSGNYGMLGFQSAAR